MQIKFIGATETVSGSKYLLILNSGDRILLDCGLYQGLGEETTHLNSKLGFEAFKVNAVILSHAHIDHCGNLPFLINQGFRGPIYCTQATADMAQLLLLDSFHIYETEIEHENKFRIKNGLKPIELLYTKEDVKQTFRLFNTIDFKKNQKINEECSLMFTSNGHVLGSCCVNLTIHEDSIKKFLTFTGDIGRYNDLMMEDPEQFPQADYIICESTYGDKLHEKTINAQQQLQAIINKTCEIKKGKLLIASFSFGRTQEILFLLKELKKQMLIPKNLKVYLDSPLSIEITRVSKKYIELYNDNFKNSLMLDDDPFLFHDLFFIEKTEQSKWLNQLEDPCVIISASGMMDAGRIKHHLFHLLSNYKNTILASGFCTPNSIGGKLLAGLKTYKLYDESIEVKAEIEKMYSLSAHADANEMLTFLSCQNKKLIKSVFLVHGETETKTKWKATLLNNGFKNVIIPKAGEMFDLKN
jgi:metallo-beta-lactamase family protein